MCWSNRNLDIPSRAIYVSRMNSAMWADYADRYRAMLRALAVLCDYVARHPGAGGFSRILNEAHSLGWLQEDGLADMGMVERSTANRWMNGKAKPSKLQQCVIMEKLAAHLKSVANEMET